MITISLPSLPGRRPTGRPLGTGAYPKDWPIRLLDVALALIALVVLAPVMALIAGVIRLTSPGPAVFRQVRVGHRLQVFEIYKFRTMRVNCDDLVHREFVTRMLKGDDPRSQPGSGLYKLEVDLRLTAVGAVLRRTSLDELPQLINVLRGDMSLVGPRPVLPWEVELFDSQFLGRFDAKPGITGLWQVCGRNRLPMQEALKLDLQYVQARNLLLYLKIVCRTIPAALRKDEVR